ncbi:T9SS type A sorting domain-containing protein [Candidatus Neomarinimicrobiota bacterium]
MKKAIIIIGLSTLFIGITFSQQIGAQLLSTDKVISQENEMIPIPGSHFLRESEQQIRDYIAAHPEAKQRFELAKRTTAWNFNVGDTHEWWASQFTAEDDEYLVPSTCRKVGEYCYIFVEDNIWEGGGNVRVTQAAVDAVQEAFDESTPANGSKGIYELDVETFGPPPDVDGDSKVVVLILDIIDSFESAGVYVGGYFWGVNEYPDGDPAIQDNRSNFAEIYYLDADPQDLSNPNQFDGALSTTAHEFQHMIHWQGDENGEGAFVNEGCASLAEVICGYDLRNQGPFNANPNIYLFYWTPADDIGDAVLADYSRSARWTQYLYEQMPSGFIYNLVQHDQNEWNGIDAALAQSGESRRFSNIFPDWVVANYLNDKSVDSKYGYDHGAMTTVLPKDTHYGPAAGSGTVQHVGAEYITFKQGSIDSVKFTGSSSLKIKAIKIGSGEVEDVAINLNYPTPGLMDGTWDEITFVLYLNSVYSTADIDYAYTGYGPGGGATIELMHDDGLPDGVLGWDTDDIISVKFDGISGGSLDSVKLAFNSAGSIPVSVNQFSGSYNPQSSAGAPFGSEYWSDTVVSPSASDQPYPNPFTNWVTVDLTSENIDATDDFIVSMTIGVDPVVPGLLATSMVDDGIRYSRVYTQGGWYYISVDGTPENIWNYMIRAYVNTAIDVEEEAIITLPTSYQLSQNFPNPFNPSTTFSYEIVEEGLAYFTVHDLLGRIVFQTQRQHLPGKYSIQWNGTDMNDQKLSSGIYLMRMEINNHASTRKMMLLK